MLIGKRDIEKMIGYHAKGSSPEVLARTVKDLGKAKSRAVIASAMGWKGCSRAFIKRCKELGASDEEIAEVERDCETYELPEPYKSQFDNGPKLADASQLRSWFPKLFKVLRDHKVQNIKLASRTPTRSELEKDSRDGRCWTLAYTVSFDYNGKHYDWNIANHTNEGGGSFGVSGQEPLSVHQGTQQDLANAAERVLKLDMTESRSFVYSVLKRRLVDKILMGYPIRESIEEELDLDEKQVHLKGAQWSTQGNCVILAGGAGSGKGWVKDNFIAADFQQVLDVDALKLMYNNLVKKGKIDDAHGEYDFSNSDDVSTLHGKIKNLKWDKLKQKRMLSQKGTLPNILFDITGREEEKVKSIAHQAKSLGYNVILCWVVTPREVAIIGNLSRDRKVGQKVFHSVHNAVKSSIISVLTTSAGDIDEAFLCFNPGKDVNQLPPEIQKIAKSHDVVALKKSGNSFVIPDDLKAELMTFLGADDDPDDPKIYKDFKDIDVSKGVASVKR